MVNSRMASTAINRCVLARTLLGRKLCRDAVEVAGAVADFRQRVHPVILVFRSEKALESLPLDLAKDAPNVGHASAPGHVVRTLLAILVAILQVKRNNPALQRLDCVQRADARSYPVAFG